MPGQQLTFGDVSDASPFQVDVSHHRAVLADAYGPERVAAMTDRKVLAELARLRSAITFDPARVNPTA